MSATSCMLQAQIQEEKKTNFADNSLLKKGWFGYFSVGGNQLYGDVSEKNFFSKWSGETQFGWNLGIGKSFLQKFDARIQFMSGHLTSQKKKFDNGETANLKIEGNVYDITINGIANISKFIWGNDLGERPSFYILVGIGSSSWKTDLTDSETGIIIGRSGALGDETSKRTSAFVFNYGIGVNIPLNNNFDINLESTQHMASSDRIDVAEGGFYRDIYQFTSVGFVYHLGGKKSAFSFGNDKGPEVYEFNSKSSEIESDGQFRVNKSNREQNNSDAPQLMEYDRTTNTYSSSSKSNTGNNQQTQSNTDKTFDFTNANGTTFTVQILASRDKINLSKINQKYEITEQIIEQYSNGFYRYYVGSFVNYKDAEKLCKKLKNSYVPDAFVVSFIQGKRVPVQKIITK